MASREVRALKGPCQHVWPSPGLISDTPLASEKQPGHAWRWVVLRRNRKQTGVGLGGRQVEPPGLEKVFLSSFQSTEKASRTVSAICYSVCFLRSCESEIRGGLNPAKKRDSEQDTADKCIVVISWCFSEDFPRTLLHLDSQGIHRALSRAAGHYGNITDLKPTQGVSGGQHLVGNALCSVYRLASRFPHPTPTTTLWDCFIRVAQMSEQIHLRI